MAILESLNRYFFFYFLETSRVENATIKRSVFAEKYKKFPLSRNPVRARKAKLQASRIAKKFAKQQMVGSRGGASSRNFGRDSKLEFRRGGFPSRVTAGGEGLLARRFTRYRETSFRESRKIHEITILSSNVHKWRREEHTTREIGAQRSFLFSSVESTVSVRFFWLRTREKESRSIGPSGKKEI